jgi:hypothetical protein
MHDHALTSPIRISLSFATIIFGILGSSPTAQATVTCYMVTSSGATLSLESLCGPDVSVGAYLHTPPVPVEPLPTPEASFFPAPFASTPIRQRDPNLELPDLSPSSSSFEFNSAPELRQAIPAVTSR